jgi:hypothetical protein
MRHHYARASKYLIARQPKTRANVGILYIHKILLIKSIDCCVCRRWKEHAHAAHPFNGEVRVTLLKPIHFAMP